MASQNKKKKAKNSFITGGAEAQKDIKCKRVWYFTKADRQKNKRSVNMFEQISEGYVKLIPERFIKIGDKEILFDDLKMAL